MSAMEELTFQVQGSAAEPYTIHFSRKGNNIRARCTCPAGTMGQYCKHRTRIIEGSAEGIISGNDNDVAKVATWLPGSDVEAALLEVRSAEDSLETAKKTLTASKKKLAKALLD